MSDYFTESQFLRMSAFEKGYVVYMYGARKDQPHIPESYEPTERTRAKYEQGQMQAMLEAMDDA